MQRKSNRTIEAILIAAVALVVVVIIAIALGTDPWLVLLIGGILVLGIVMVNVSGMSGSP